MKRTQPKRQRIPRRGPGVAELEKILQEQEGGGGGGQDQDDISPLPPTPPPPSFFQHRRHSPSSIPSSLNQPPPLLPPPLTRDYASWSNLPLFPNLDFIPPTLPTTAAAEKPLFPTTRKSDAQMNLPPHFLPTFQYSASSHNLEHYNTMMNIIPGSATSSAARYFRQIEHPSSQISTDFNNIWTSPEEQQKMVSAKRVRPFLDESHRDPNLENRAPILTNMVAKDSSSSSSSSMEMNRSPFNLDLNLRGTKRGFAGKLMSSSKRSGSYQLAEDSHLMALGCSSSASNEIAAFNFHPSQETMEDSQYRGAGGSSASHYGKITLNSSFSLYESKSKSKGNKEIVIGSGFEAEAEAEAKGIDLDLKL